MRLLRFHSNTVPDRLSCIFLMCVLRVYFTAGFLLLSASHSAHTTVYCMFYILPLSNLNPFTSLSASFHNDLLLWLLLLLLRLLLLLPPPAPRQRPVLVLQLRCRVRPLEGGDGKDPSPVGAVALDGSDKRLHVVRVPLQPAARSIALVLLPLLSLQNATTSSEVHTSAESESRRPPHREALMGYSGMEYVPTTHQRYRAGSWENAFYWPPSSAAPQ